MPGEGLDGFFFVEAVADGLVGDARAARLELEEEVKHPEVDASAAAEERCACHAVSAHGEGALAHAAVGEGGGGDGGGGQTGGGLHPKGGGRMWSGVRADGVAEEWESEIGGRVQEGEPGVRGAAGGEKGVIHGDVPVGCLGSRLGRDLGEPFLAGCEGGPRVGEDALERFQGRGGQSEDCAGGGGDGGGGEDGSARDVAAGG